LKMSLDTLDEQSQVSFLLRCNHAAFPFSLSRATMGAKLQWVLEWRIYSTIIP
jgi:hypothetical protein